MREKWAEERAKLERELIQAKSIVRRYEGTLKPYRDVTDSDYREAKAKMWQLASAISEGDFEANKPINPLDGMTREQLKARIDELKGEVTAVKYEGQTIARKDSRKLAQIMRIQTKLQAMGDDN